MKNNKREIILGIDLGTTNSCVSIFEGGAPVIIPNREGNRTTPSVVSFSKEDSGERHVGTRAKRQAITNPDRTIFSIKRFIGKEYEHVKSLVDTMPYEVKEGANKMCKVRIGSRHYTPQEVSAMILQELKTFASEFAGQKVTKAVVTVPAYFNDQERQATKEAGEIAGLEVVRIINEPTAAALAYGLQKKDRNLKIAVYDLGGGTFDISILECEGGLFEVKATNGDVALGGDNFDECIVAWIREKFKKEEGIDLGKDVSALQRLKEAAEKAKKELSQAATTEINLPFITASSEGPKHLVMEFTRSEFEKICDEFFQKTLEPCRKALNDSGFAKEDIDEVILVGGSTRIPKIQEQVAAFFGKEPSKSVNPDEVVAMGAAVQGGIILGDVKGVVLLDVTSLSLGLETMGGVFTVLIPANTAIPTKRSEIFSTAADNQTSVDIKVSQGERAMAKDNKFLGQFHLDDIPPAPRGEPKIEVTFSIDVDGIVHVSAKDQKTNKTKDIRIETASLNKEEVERMKKEAEEYAEKDKKEREKIEKLNKADAAIFQMSKQLKEQGDKIKAEDKKQIETLLDSLKKAYEDKDLQKIDSLMEEQQKLWSRVMLEILQNQAKKDGPETPSSQASAQSNNEEEADFEEVESEPKKN